MKSIITIRLTSFTTALCAGTVMLLAAGAQAQLLYEADWGSGYIFSFSPSGSQSFVTGGLSNPEGLAFDNSGNLYIANEGGNDIVKYSSGAQSVFASGVGQAWGLAFNSTGNLFVSSLGGTIYQVSANGSSVTTFKSGLNQPNGLAFDSAGDLFEADWGSGDINEFKNIGGTLSTTPTLYASTGGNPTGLTFNGGNLFVGMGGTTGSVLEIKPGDVQSTFASSVVDPYGLAFNNAGDLFVASGGSPGGNSITEFSPTGTPMSPAFASGLDSPLGIAFQPVPEPSMLALAGAGIGTLLVFRRRKS
jgi:sugar lactone lactonase YvrE